MKQILQSFRNGELWLADVPVPRVGDQSVLVQTSHSLVSAGTERMLTELAKKSLLGKARARPDLVRKVLQRIKTDGLRTAMSKAFAKLDAPITMGYSCAGTVIEVGREVTDLQPGDRVACGGAGYATHAEFNVVPRNLLAKIPDGVSTEAACFTTVGAIAMQGVRQADVRLGERIVVTGLGLLGLLTVQILKASGCAVLGVDPDVSRCELAKKLGADRVVDQSPVELAQAWSEGRGVDAVIVTASTQSDQPLHDAAAMLRLRGRVVVVGVVGMNVPRDDFYRKELDLRLSMSYGPGRYDRNYEELGEDYPFGLVRWTEQRNLQCFVDLLATGSVTPEPLISGRYPIEEGLAAYEALSDRGQLGLLLSYPTEERNPARTVTLAATTNSLSGSGIGLIGAGSFAKGVLLPVLRRVDGLTPVGICTDRGMSASETGQRHGFEYATTDADVILADERIAGVVISTRHDSHADLVVRSLAAGKHVFVEKPLCLDAVQLAAIDAAVVTGPGILTVGYNRRFSRHTTAVAAVFEERGGPLVIQYRVNAGRVPQDSWIQDAVDGGGRIIGEMCHFLDFCQSLTGSALRSVAAAKIGGGDQRSSGDDSVAVTLTYADGSLATVLYLADGSGTLPKERIEVHADGISAVIDDFLSTRFYGCRASRVSGPQDKGFEAELRTFLQSVQGGGSFPIPYSDLRETSLATFAVLESLRTGKRVAFDSGSDQAEDAR